MSINKDQVKGRIKEAQGKVKEIAGKAAGDTALEIEGKVQGAVGGAQAKFGDIKSDLKNGKNSKDVNKGR